jgi:hypothetical protein
MMGDEAVQAEVLLCIMMNTGHDTNGDSLMLLYTRCIIYRKASYIQSPPHQPDYLWTSGNLHS